MRTRQLGLGLLGISALLWGCGGPSDGRAATTAGGSNGSGGNGTVSAGGSDTSSSGGSAHGGNTSTTTGGSDTSSSGGSSNGGSGDAGSNAGGSGGGGIVTAQGCPTTQAPGTWQEVTDPEMNTGDYQGPITVGVDVVKPNEIYLHVQTDGTWKSLDCGMTWTKVSTGTNSSQQDSGRQWFAAIDRNPNRDPDTAPTMYVTQGYGALGLWKSTNGGVDWEDIWSGNIFAADGTTNISADVGNDISGVFIVEDTGPDHLIVYLHSYWGDQGNNGVFESTDGGEKWIVHKAETFNFQPHSDILFPFDATTWMVTHGTSWPSAAVFRTTDSGTTWETSESTVSVNLARAYFKVGSTFYAGSDYTGNAYKSTDAGLTWSSLNTPGNQSSWVVATETHLYASNGRGDPAFYSAPIDDDTNWTDEGATGRTSGGANTPGLIFDGEHYVIIEAAENGGVWRYVEE